MILPEPPEFIEFLAPYPATTQDLARALRRRLVGMQKVPIVQNGVLSVAG